MTRPDPCPFCGGVGEIEYDNRSGGLQIGIGPAFVTCQTCCARGPTHRSAVKATRLWNKRTYTNGDQP